MKIQMQQKERYGRDLFYPVCDKAKALARLVGQTTLTQDNLRILVKDLGIEIEWIPSMVKLD